MCRLRPRDSSRAVLWWCPDLYGFRGSLIGPVVHWRTRYILPPLPHCLWWLLGYRRTRVPARLRPPAARVIPPGLPAAAASSSVRPPAFLAPPRPRVRPARGPPSLGSPHPSAWLHEAGEGRAREVRSSPAAPGPGEKVRNSCCAVSAGPDLLRAAAAMPVGPPHPGKLIGRGADPRDRGEGPGQRGGGAPGRRWKEAAGKRGLLAACPR